MRISPKSGMPVVVVSALAGVTDKLVAIAQLAEEGAPYDLESWPEY